jgi:hypothetical protein
MSDFRVVVRPFSARQWSRVPYEYEDFEPGDRVIALRHESGHSIFARESDPITRYIIEIDDFRVFTKSVDSEKMLRARGSETG